MFKRSSLALALVLSTLGAAPASAAIVSIDYAGTITGGLTVNGTISWDAASTGTQVPNSFQRFTFSPSSVSLFVNQVDYSSHLSNLKLEVSETQGNQDNFAMMATLSGIAALQGAEVLVIDFSDFGGGLVNGWESLPSSFNAFSGVGATRFNARSLTNSALSWAGNLTFSETVASTPPTTSAVPEPGSLLLVALAGLALSATRRRTTAA
jgi:hypothetical protein